LDTTVKHPSHYTDFMVQPADFIMQNELPFHVGNIIKYACRAGNKKYEGKSYAESEVTDLKKAMRYAEMRINQIEGRDIIDG
tara:strand:+ start:701 stop:946 length:246 start_codon:yes stop_codon:yes gene_type:complete